MKNSLFPLSHLALFNYAFTNKRSRLVDFFWMMYINKGLTHILAVTTTIKRHTAATVIHILFCVYIFLLLGRRNSYINPHFICPSWAKVENVYRGTREREMEMWRESESVLMHERRDSCNEDESFLRLSSIETFLRSQYSVFLMIKKTEGKCNVDDFLRR